MKKSLLRILLTVLLSVSIISPVGAAGTIDGYPVTLYGSVMINGSPAPAGTTVEARGENVRTGIEDNPLITTETGQYGGPGLAKKLVIQPEDNETPIETGTIISFFINGVEADQTFIVGETSYSLKDPFNLTVTIPVSRLETITSLTSSNNPSTVNRSVTFTAAVSSKSASEHQPSGPVIFYDGTTLLGEYSLTGGQASYSTSALSRGTHTLKAVYQGDLNFLGSENSLEQTVKSSGSGGSGGGSAGTTTTTTTTTSQTTTTQTTPPVSTTTTSAAPIKVLDLSGYLDSSGHVNQSIEGKSLDGKAKISFFTGTRCTTAAGIIVTQITIQQVNNPGGNPPPTAAFGMAALCYDFQPSGALFSQPVSITITYDPGLIPAGEKPYIAWWNSATDKWEKLETAGIDLVNNTVTVNVSHFTIYSVLFKKPETSSTSAVATTTTTAATSKTTPSPATTSSPKTPSGPSSTLIIGLIVVFIAVVIIVVYVVLKRKSKTGGSK